MEYVDVRVAMVTLLLSVAALVVVFVLMLRKQKRMYVAGLEELGKLYDNALSELSRLTNEVFKSDTKAAELTSHRNQLQETNKQLEDRCSMYVNMVAERDKEIEQQKEQIAAKDGDINELNQRLIGFTAENSIHKTSIENYKAEISGLKKQIAELNERWENAQKAIDGAVLNHVNDTQSYEIIISGLKKQLAVQKGVITKLRKKLDQNRNR